MTPAILEVKVHEVPREYPDPPGCGSVRSNQ